MLITGSNLCYFIIRLGNPKEPYSCSQDMQITFPNKIPNETPQQKGERGNEKEPQHPPSPTHDVHSHSRKLLAARIAVVIGDAVLPRKLPGIEVLVGKPIGQGLLAVV